MSRTELETKLEEIRAVRTEVLELLTALTDTETALETPDLGMSRNLGMALLRFGDHMREHKNQLVGARQSLGIGPTDAQRKLGDAEVTWGQLLGAVVGLSDSDLDTVPAEGEWSIRETLDHIHTGEQYYLKGVKSALSQTDQE